MNKKFWLQDILAGISVSFVALPLSMGIALAIGYPIESGILSAIVGGTLGWVFGGTRVGVKGPGAGSIVVLISAFIAFKECGLYTNPLLVLLASTFVAGLMLMLTGFLKLGRFAQVLSSGAINGFLAGIGFIIAVSQLGTLMGYVSDAAGPAEAFLEIVSKVQEINVLSLLFGLLSVLVLILHKYLPSNTLRAVPAAIWLLLISVCLVLSLGLNLKNNIVFFGTSWNIGDDFFINIGKNVFNNLRYPNFYALNTTLFWLQTIGIFIILLVENLLSAKAIDKIDPLNRTTDLDNDLSSSGFVTAISSLIGGMPAITVIARSSVNISVGGITRLSNFTQGIVLLFLLTFAIPFINIIPKPALAAILIAAGLKLCAPRVFANEFKKGWEQLFIFTITFYTTIRYGLILGIFLGLVMDFLMSFFLADTKLFKFWKSSIHPLIETSTHGSNLLISIKGVITFLSIMKIKKALANVSPHQSVKVDLSEAQVVDRTILELLSDEALLLEKNGGYLEIIGLKNHHTSSPHPMALHLLTITWKKNALHTSRQFKLKRFAQAEGFSFLPDRDYKTGYLQSFAYFKTRLIEFKQNVVKGNLQELHNFELADFHFLQGELSTQEFHKTTVLSFKPGFNVPAFSINTYTFLDKIKGMVSENENETQLKTINDPVKIVALQKDTLDEILKPHVIAFIAANDSFFIESNGTEIVLFKQLKTATVAEVRQMMEFAKGLLLQLESLNRA